MMSNHHQITNFLETATIADLKKNFAGMIALPPNASIETALTTLANRAITAVGVYDEQANQFLGFVDTLDLSVFIVQLFIEHFKQHPHLYDPKQLGSKFQLPISDVINASSRDIFYPVDLRESLAYLISNFLQYAVHRVPVLEDGRIKGIVSQSDVISFLYTHRDKLEPLMSLHLPQLRLDRGQVITVRNDEYLMKAFSTILAHNITGLAVVDLKGQVVSSISASDLKGISKESFFKLEIPIHEVLLYQPHKLPPVVCGPQATLKEVIELVHKTGVHRVFVVDEEQRPLNVITLTDILHVFARPSEYF